MFTSERKKEIDYGKGQRFDVQKNSINWPKQFNARGQSNNDQSKFKTSRGSGEW